MTEATPSFTTIIDRAMDMTNPVPTEGREGHGTGHTLPDCMMPDGAEPCIAFQRLKAERDGLLAALREIAKDEDCQYGFFPGGDPRKFTPDGEDCTDAERAAHKEACRIWDEAEAAGRSMNPAEPSGSWLASDDGKTVMHILKANFGIGTYSYSTYVAQLARAALAKAEGR